MTKNEALMHLWHAFDQGGCARVPNSERIETEGYRTYKKGHEIRFSCRTDEEVLTLLAALKKLAIQNGNLYVKGNITVTPVYGKDTCHYLRECLSSAERLIESNVNKQ